MMRDIDTINDAMDDARAVLHSSCGRDRGARNSSYNACSKYLTTKT
jgi:hypothetical protein